MIKILRYLKKQEWLQVAACLVLIFAQVFLDLKMPDYMSEITILIRTPGNNAAAVWLAGGKMLLCALGSHLANSPSLRDSNLGFCQDISFSDSNCCQDSVMTLPIQILQDKLPISRS